MNRGRCQNMLVQLSFIFLIAQSNMGSTQVQFETNAIQNASAVLTPLRHDLRGAFGEALQLSKAISDASNLMSPTSAFSRGNTASKFGSTPIFGKHSTSDFGYSAFSQVNYFEGSAITPREGLNRAATGTEAERLHSFIQHREADLTVLSRELSTEQNLLKACQLAISDHVDDIQKAKSILKINQDNLASLTGIRSRLDGVKASQNDIMNDQSLMQDIYSSLRIYLTIPLDPMLLQLDKQIEALGREIQTLWDRIHQLEVELVRWKASKGLIEHTVKRIDANYLSIESDMRVAVTTQSPRGRSEP
jgi:hypothetical protein